SDERRRAGSFPRYLEPHRRRQRGQEIVSNLAAFKADLIELLPSLRAFARSLAHNPALADDLVQDTLVKALANVERFEPGTNLRAWLFTILRNHYYSQLRKSKREVEDADGKFAARMSSRPEQDGS